MFLFQALLLRCSQPMIGPQNKRSRADEKFLNCLIGTNNKGFIFDLRSAALVTLQKGKGIFEIRIGFNSYIFINVFVNSGGGMESDSYYPKWRKVNRPMDKISNLQLLESFTKLMEGKIEKCYILQLIGLFYLNFFHSL